MKVPAAYIRAWRFLSCSCDGTVGYRAVLLLESGPGSECTPTTPGVTQ